MKPTDDERREVAKRLRENAESNPHMGLLLNVAFADCSLRPEGAFEWEVSPHDAALRLADLIEPEERTCHIEFVDVTDSLGQKMHRCSECGALMTDDACFFEGVDEVGWYSYCPNCGAKVVDDHA